MSNSKPALAIIFFLLSLCPEATARAQTRETNAGTATVSGHVKLRGAPARGATVLLQRALRSPQSDPVGSPRATVDEDGRFQFARVAAGRYMIFAVAAGYAAPVDAEAGRDGLSLSVADGEKVENLALELKLGAVITGRITDSVGRPVVEENVTLYKRDKNGGAQMYRLNNLYNEMYRTDDRGEYRIFGLPEGRYMVCVGQEQKTGSAALTLSDIFYPRVYYPNATGQAEAKVIEVAEGSEASGIDIVLPGAKKPYNVYGRVVGADMVNPASLAEFRLGSLSQDGRLVGGWALSNSRIKSSGEFHLKVVSPGRYALWALIDGGFIGEPATFEVQEGDVTGVEVKVHRPGSIDGVVVIEGASDPNILSKLSQVLLAGSYLSVKSSFPGMPIFAGIPDAKVNPDGSFRIGDLEPGRIIIRLARSQGASGLTVARIERDGRALRDGIEVGPGEKVPGVRVILSYSALAIRGVVNVVGGELPSGLRLHVAARRIDLPTQSPLSGELDARGHFLIEGAPPGEYELEIFPAYNPYSDRLDPSVAQPISSAKKKTVVTADNQSPVVLIVDLSRKEGN